MSQDNLTKNSKWIWYPDDFEMYHSMLLHNRREVRGQYYSCFWELESPHKTVRVYKTAVLEKSEKFKAISNTNNLEIIINGKRYKSNKWIDLEPGKNFIKLTAYSEDKIPCFYAYGDTFATNETWNVARFGDDDIQVGYNDMYVSPKDDPTVFKFKYKLLNYKEKIDFSNGTLYDFGKETFGKLIVTKNTDKPLNVKIIYGESKEEALDEVCCNLSEEAVLNDKTTTFRSRACRFIFIKGNTKNLDIKYNYEYLPVPDTGSFSCNVPLYNKIWKASKNSLVLNTREGYLDGIKRDRWVWGGDAYQSILTNTFVSHDFDTTRRTLTILRGRNITQHINTIVDYSAYWIMSLYDYYYISEDISFLKRSYPKAFQLIDLFTQSMDGNGFTIGSKKRGDWTFIDWSDIDKTGAVCAEQMLLYRAYVCMSKMAYILEKYDMSEYFDGLALKLKENINLKYWDEEKGAYIDSFESGLRKVTRHANIFAISFGVCSEEQKSKIIKNVIYNDEITQITTPYFKFFELDMMCSLGDFTLLKNMLDTYWGGMIKLGATSMWEQFDPTRKGIDHYEMYGAKFGNSLCHAWGASPIYLIGKYVCGFKPTSEGYKTFELKPNFDIINEFSSSIPVSNRGDLEIKSDKDTINVKCSCSGGKLIYKDKVYDIDENKTLIIKR